MTADQIPLVDLVAQDREIRTEVLAGWAKVLDATAFIGGSAVREFERAFADVSGVAHCVGVGNGTDALKLALRAAGLKPGDEVIVPANSFIASAVAVVEAGGRPIFADCDPEYLLLDPAAVEVAITSRTGFIMPVHLFGQMAPMTEIMALVKRHNLEVIEDAAQCQGASQLGQPAGTWGIAAGTSFYPGKNLGAYGDAGAVLTDDADLAQKVRALGNYGSLVKYEHPELGTNSRLDALQAVVLLAKLKRLSGWNRDRAEAANYYSVNLGSGIRLPAVCLDNRSVWHIYAVRVVAEVRDRVLATLIEAGIGAGIHYPKPIHLQGAFAGHGHREGDFPVAEAAAREMISLPLSPHITHIQQDRVMEELTKALLEVGA